LDDPDRFILEPPPVGRKARFVARVQAEHDHAERLGRRERWFAEFKARAFLVTHGCDLVDFHEEGVTLADVVNVLVARIEAARDGKNPPTRWWSKDFAVFQGSRLLAVVRVGPDRHPVTTVFEDRGGS
jgi:hypothetical protein